MENTEVTKTKTSETETSEIQPLKNNITAKHKANQPCKYYKADFILNPKILGFDPLVVKTALERSEKTDFTVSEAKDIVKKFAEKEVKK